MNDLLTRDGVSDSVKIFVEHICAMILIHRQEEPVQLDWEDCESEDETKHGEIAMIQTAWGLVHVYPNFRTDRASAFVIARGRISSMLSEGLDFDNISDVDGLLSREFEHSAESARFLGKYLTGPMLMTREIFR